MTEIKLLKVTKSAMDYYRKNIKGNENATELDIQKKLTRNVYLAIPTKRRNEEAQLFLYGRLEILVKNGDEIVWIKANDKKCNFTVDKQRKEELNKLLQIK